MFAALLAASLATAAGPQLQVVRGFGPTLAGPACHNATMETADPVDPALLLRPQDRTAARFRQLGDLPKANKEIAVLRQVRGCTVPVVISYGVELDGRAAGGN